MQFQVDARSAGFDCSPDNVTVNVLPTNVEDEGLTFDLRWNTADVDLDLYVAGPDGQTVSFFDPGPSSIGGFLLTGDATGTNELREVVQFPAASPDGNYCVLVHNFSPTTTETFEINIKLGNQIRITRMGSVGGLSSASPDDFALVVTRTGEVISTTADCSPNSAPVAIDF